MSLDVYLEINETVMSEAKIYIREDGQNRVISPEEWEERFPGTEPIIINEHENNEVYSGNITHNLGRMAKEAGIYQHLWRPDEIGIKKAIDLINPLKDSLKLLCSDPERFKAYNPSNRWGDYEGLVEFMENYLVACEKYPDADVSVWR